MKFYATVIAALLGVAAAQEEEKPKEYVDSQKQVAKLVDTNQAEGGTLEWYTRTWFEKGGKENVTELYYECNPLQAANKPYLPNDFNDREIECMLGPISPKTDGKDMADWCRVKAKLKPSENKMEKTDEKDGKLKDYEGRGANDKWKFEDDPGDKQACKYYAEETEYGWNEAKTEFSPTIAWYKPIMSEDGDDFSLKFKDNLTVYWQVKDTKAERKGSFAGFYVDDPQNPVLTGAKTLIAGSITAAALIATTLA